MLAGLFWGDQPQDRARGSMNTTLWRLRPISAAPATAAVIQGEVAIEDLEPRVVRVCLPPATLGEYAVTATTATTLLRTYVNEACA